MRNSMLIVSIIVFTLASCEANKEVTPNEIVFKMSFRD